MIAVYNISSYVCFVPESPHNNFTIHSRVLLTVIWPINVLHLDNSSFFPRLQKKKEVDEYEKEKRKSNDRTEQNESKNEVVVAFHCS